MIVSIRNSGQETAWHVVCKACGQNNMAESHDSLEMALKLRNW
jgi:hypothetical protein